MQSGYELFDHTADVGVRCFAPTLPELLAPAGAGLYATIGDVISGPPGPPVELEFLGDDPALLLRDYLAELLRRFETRHEVQFSVDVQEFRPERLAVAVRFGPLDPAASALEREAKAVTYHELAIRPVAGGFEATFVVDI